MSAEAWAAFWAVTFDTGQLLAAGAWADWLLRGGVDACRRRRDQAQHHSPRG